MDLAALKVARSGSIVFTILRCQNGAFACLVPNSSRISKICTTVCKKKILP